MNKIKPSRKLIRLKGYDYSNRGWYYVTVCTQNRKCIFGEIENGKMALNNVGRMVNHWYLKIPDRFKNIVLDQYQIMPNHMHGIIVINDGQTHMSATNGRTHGSAPTTSRTDVTTSPTVGVDPGVDPKPSLSKIIQWFKTMTTNQYIQNVKNKNWKKFHNRIWQRNYWEHIIRTHDDLNKIRTYIKNNPKMWDRDRNNPKNISVF